MAVAGSQALLDRAAGFRAGLAEQCPDINADLQSYNNNHIATAAAQVNDAISANSDLVGIFADDNTSGVGAATAIEDNDAADSIPVVAFHSDPAENAALAAGTIDALVIQNPYFFGYQGVFEAAMTTRGRIPNLLIVFLAITAVTVFVLNRTVFGRYVYAVGSNPEAARLAGVPVAMVTAMVYAVSGLLAAVGGVLLTSRLGAGVPTAGTGFELQAIAACVIGGASLSGARAARSARPAVRCSSVC